MQYVRVSSLEEIISQLDEPGVAILCGGTDLLVKIRQGLLQPERLVDVSDVQDLRGIRMIDGILEIGAATPQEDLLRSQAVLEHLPLLRHVLRTLGSPQIRNRGTLGGNLVNASPAADSAIPLLLYDAELALRSVEGERCTSVESFLVGPGRKALRPGEFVRSIRVPIPQGEPAAFFHKVGRRRALTIAIASIGSLIRMDGGVVVEARLAAGSVSPVPLRLRAVEELLVGARLDAETIAGAREAARATVSPISDVRATADYRRDVVGDLVARALRSAQS